METLKDETGGKSWHNYREKLQWVLDRAQDYASATGMDAGEILDAWESRRDYWYMNYYQESNQPKPDGKKVRVFESTNALLASVGKLGFRCPSCGGVSKSPYECNACDWKVYGLFGHMGKGTSVFVKDGSRIEKIFMPVAWEVKQARSACLLPSFEDCY